MRPTIPASTLLVLTACDDDAMPASDSDTTADPNIRLVFDPRVGHPWHEWIIDDRSVPTPVPPRSTFIIPGNPALTHPDVRFQVVLLEPDGPDLALPELAWQNPAGDPEDDRFPMNDHRTLPSTRERRPPEDRGERTARLRPLWRHTLCVAVMNLSVAGCNTGGGGDGGGSSTTGGPVTTDDGPSTTDEGPGMTTTSGNEADSTTGGNTDTTGSTDSTETSSGGADTETSGCGDLDNDPANCGFCGHDCNGAACVGGYCEPTVYEDNEIGPQDLGLTEQYLFWMDYSAALLRCEISGCPGGAEIFSPYVRVASLVIQDDVIFFGSYETDELLSCPVSGCGGAPTIIGSGLSDPYGPHIQGDTVYFVNGADVVSCPTSGCGGPPTVLTTATEPLQIETIGSVLFFSDRMGDEILRCDLPNCAGGPTVVAPMQDGPLDIERYGPHIYWVNQAGGEVRRCDPANCAATIETLATGQDAPTKFAIDDDGIYWVNFGSPQGSVAGCTDHTCSEGSVLFADDQMGAVAIQLDQDNIYWANFGTGFDSGGVYSVPK